MILKQEREQVVEYGKKLIETGLTVGTFGNISVYNPEKNLMAISPSGMDYYKTEPEDIVVLTPEGEKVDGNAKPSSEYDLHRIFYLKRPGIRAVIHAHSPFATTLACMQWSIPPLHYIVGYSGREVPCIPYVQFGTYELAEAALAGMGENHAVLLGNHGLITVGSALRFTLDIAQQVEFAAQLYYRCRALGEPKLLTEEQMAVVLNAFESYRQK
ncbi:MAG: L-fuculose-phosphate aldolase [Intestinibacillus sp.]